MDLSTGPLSVVLPRRRDPFEILFSAVFAVSGLSQLALGARPGSVNELMPGWFSVVWLTLMTSGAIGVLVGVYWRHLVNGLFIESVSLLAVGFSVCMYGAGLAVLSIGGDNPGGRLFVGPLTFVLGLAFWWKHHQVQATIRGLPKK